MGPWMVPWVVVRTMLHEYGIELYLTQLKYIVWVKCTNSAEIESIRIAVPAVSGMLWWSHSD